MIRTTFLLAAFVSLAALGASPRAGAVPMRPLLQTPETSVTEVQYDRYGGSSYHHRRHRHRHHHRHYGR